MERKKAQKIEKEKKLTAALADSCVIASVGGGDGGPTYFDLCGKLLCSSLIGFSL